MNANIYWDVTFSSSFHACEKTESLGRDTETNHFLEIIVMLQERHGNYKKVVIFSLYYTYKWVKIWQFCWKMYRLRGFEDPLRLWLKRGISNSKSVLGFLPKKVWINQMAKTHLNIRFIPLRLCTFKVLEINIE